MKEGVFQIEELSPGRWRMLNELTGETHVTYGTAEEVRQRATDQTKAWREKRSRKGTPWRHYKL